MYLWEKVPQEIFDMGSPELDPIAHATVLFKPEEVDQGSRTLYCGRVLIRRVSFLPRWTWCFSNKWKTVDNTPQGAAQRIFALVAYGLPLDYADQLVEDAALSYKELVPELVVSEEEGQYEGGSFEFSRVSLEERKKREKS